MTEQNEIPLVTVVIPVRNGASTITASIESVFAQNFTRPFETIVVNDGSTDETLAMIVPYGQRIKVVSTEPRGLSSARNAGIYAARGKFIAFLDADDTWSSDKLARTVALLEEDDRLVLAYSDATGVDAAGNVLIDQFVPPAHSRAPSMSDLLTEYWHMLPSAVVMRRDVLIKIGGFCAEFDTGYYCEDLYAWLLGRECGPFAYVPAKLVRYQLSNGAQRITKRANMSGRADDPMRYVSNESLLTRLVRERYGDAAKGLLKNIRSGQANTLMLLGLAAMSLGNREFARRCYRCSLRTSLLQPKALARLAASMLPEFAARSLHNWLPSRYSRALYGPLGA